MVDEHDRNPQTMTRMLQQKSRCHDIADAAISSRPARLSLPQFDLEDTLLQWANESDGHMEPSPLPNTGIVLTAGAPMTPPSEDRRGSIGQGEAPPLPGVLTFRLLRGPLNDGIRLLPV